MAFIDQEAREKADEIDAKVNQNNIMFVLKVGGVFKHYLCVCHRFKIV